MTLDLDVVVKRLKVRRLIFQTLILGEFVAEAHSQVVQFAILVKNHFQGELIDFSFCVQQVHYLLLIILFWIKDDGDQVTEVWTGRS